MIQYGTLYHADSIEVDIKLLHHAHHRQST